jgi:hypothetical protein
VPRRGQEVKERHEIRADGHTMPDGTMEYGRVGYNAGKNKKV